MKKLLVVVDYQNDFVDGTLGFAGAELLDGVIADKIKTYRAENNSVVFTKDTHYDDYLDTQEGRNLPVAHCIENSHGWEIYGKTGEMVQSGDKIFLKNTFGSDELYEYIKKSDYESIELVGLVSNICVISNAVLAKTARPEAVIIVDSNATKSFDNSLNDKTIDVLKGLQVKVV